MTVLPMNILYAQSFPLLYSFSAHLLVIKLSMKDCKLKTIIKVRVFKYFSNLWIFLKISPVNNCLYITLLSIYKRGTR